MRRVGAVRRLVFGFVRGLMRVLVRVQLGGRIGLIVDGGTSPRDVASTIIDMSNPDNCTILREGAIPETELAEYLH